MPDAPPYADLIVMGRPCVAAKDGAILYVGTADDVRGLAGSETEIVDLGEALVLPGLLDAHVHLAETALARRRLDLGGLGLAEIRRAIQSAAAQTAAGEWIRGSGFSIDILGREPTAADLDDIAPDQCVKLTSHDLHSIWVNSRALAAAGRSDDSPSYLSEDDVREFEDAAGREDAAERLSALRDFQGELHVHGITRVREHGRLEDLLALAGLAVSGEMLFRAGFTFRDHQILDYLDAAQRLPDLAGLLDVEGQKMFLDGALGSHTAWTLEPYEGLPTTGHRALDHDVAAKRVRFAAGLGFPTFFHAIGDAAVREALDLAALAPGLPHRVEHAQLIHPDDLPRFTAQGVVASLQPVHLLTDTPVLRAIWGDMRAARSFPVRSLLESGARVRLGSDTPVETLNPMHGIFAAATRTTFSGERLPGEETVPVEIALALSLSFPSLEPGRPADLVAFTRSPVEVDLSELPHVKPACTVFGGQVVHRA